MTPLGEGQPSPDFADRVDSALQALWQGDSAAFEHLLETRQIDDAGLVELFDVPALAYAVPLIGLTKQSALPGYRVIREIGRGGMGVVYEAEQEIPRRRVALKVLAGLCDDEYHLKLFRREIQTLARLRHPGIATIYDAGCSIDGRHFFAMELVQGSTLTKHVTALALTLAQRLRLFVKICDAVDYAHLSGVVHRDLKPANILIDASGQPRILDFGVARITNADVTASTSAAEAGKIVGTVAYMSPEQARGRPEEIDARSDVYALGVILHELLTNRLPYELSKLLPHEMLRVICDHSPERPSKLISQLHRDLDSIVLKALEKEASCRYQSVGELAADVRRFLAGDPVRARAAGIFYLLGRKITKHRFVAGIGGMVAVLALLAAVAAYWRRERAVNEARLEVVRQQRLSENRRARDVLGPADSLVASFPSLPEARLMRAQATFREARTTGAGDLRQRALSQLKLDLAGGLPVWAYRALLAELLSDEQLRAAAAWDAPDTAEAWYLRTYTTLVLDDAWRFAATALQRAPQRRLAPLAWERFATLSLDTARYEDAIRAARKLRELGGEDLKWMLFEGEVLTRAQRYVEAIEQYNGVALRFPSRFEAYRYRGVSHMCLKEYAEACEDFSNALGLSPANARAHLLFLRATPHWILGQEEEAAADYRAFRESQPLVEYAKARLFLVLQDRARELDRTGQAKLARERRREAQHVLGEGLRESVARQWPLDILACLASRLPPEELVAAGASDPKRLCEASYYAGEFCRLNERIDDARAWFQECVDTCLAIDPDSTALDPMNEYHLAVWRLDQLAADRVSPPAAVHGE